MAKTAQEIVHDIEGHFNGLVGQKNFSDLYIGITKSIEDRLYGFHQVPREKHWFITRRALNSEHARAVEKYFLDKWMKGGGGGWDHTAVFVYCYEIASYTVE